MTSSAKLPELSDLLARLRETHQVIPALALELEWYVMDADDTPVDDDLRSIYLTQLESALASLPLHSLNAEDGRGQVEAALLPTRDIAVLIAHANQLKDIAASVADALNVNAIFTAKPFPHDYGSGLHVHVHLESTDGASLYQKQGETISPMLSHSVGGLLATMADCLPIFAGEDNTAPTRYTPGYHAPTTISWGMNNRTTALRLPDGTGMASGDADIRDCQPQANKRIEHRVSASSADVEQVICAILHGIDTGITQQLHAPDPTYGNADDAQYALTQLIMTYPPS